MSLPLPVKLLVGRLRRNIPATRIFTDPLYTLAKGTDAGISLKGNFPDIFSYLENADTLFPVEFITDRIRYLTSDLG